MSINYKTVQDFGKAEFEINRSRFIAFVQRVSTEEAAIEFIKKIRKEYWDARHNCSAYIIGERGMLQKADDDGEPSGTAGKPILEVIKNHDLKDVVIVVTRYFGGIKLGASGLIRAYNKAATLGIESSIIIEKILFRRLEIAIDYKLLGTLENNLRINQYRIEKKDFREKVYLTILAPLPDEATVTKDLINWTSANCDLVPGELIYLEIPLN